MCHQRTTGTEAENAAGGSPGFVSVVATNMSSPRCKSSLHESYISAYLTPTNVSGTEIRLFFGQVYSKTITWDVNLLWAVDLHGVNPAVSVLNSRANGS